MVVLVTNQVLVAHHQEQLLAAARIGALSACRVIILLDSKQMVRCGHGAEVLAVLMAMEQLLLAHRQEQLLAGEQIGAP
jgi:hypothetical protein